MGLCYIEKKIKIGCLTHASHVARQETESLYHQVQYSRACVENMRGCAHTRSFLTKKNAQSLFSHHAIVQLCSAVCPVPADKSNSPEYHSSAPAASAPFSVLLQDVTVTVLLCFEGASEYSGCAQLTLSKILPFSENVQDAENSQSSVLSVTETVC